MSKANIIRAWKDEAYRHSLSAEQRAVLPANPVGAIELHESQLDDVSGGNSMTCTCTGARPGSCGEWWTK